MPETPKKDVPPMKEPPPPVRPPPVREPGVIRGPIGDPPPKAPSQRDPLVPGETPGQRR
jgi:hypothetical protein